MISDDTEHACLVAQSLIASHGDAGRFANDLGYRLRRWFLTLPAGLGLATVKACLNLCVGVSPSNSGVFSAGNGPLMRCVILGVAVRDRDLLRQLVKASTRITHTDPKAELSAVALALCSRMTIEATSQQELPSAFLTAFMEQELLPEDHELPLIIGRVVQSVASGQSTLDFAISQGWTRGVSGYVYHTLPAVLHAVWSHPRDYAKAIQSVIECGGDTDTTAALVGGILGARLGPAAIPQEWLDGLREWPQSLEWIRQLGEQLAGVLATQQLGPSSPPTRPRQLPFAGLLARNLGFLAIVICHVIRRLLPPY